MDNLGTMHPHASLASHKSLAGVGKTLATKTISQVIRHSHTIRVVINNHTISLVVVVVVVKVNKHISKMVVVHSQATVAEVRGGLVTIINHTIKVEVVISSFTIRMVAAHSPTI